MLEGDIIAFLEESFAVLRNRQFNPNWVWHRGSLQSALEDLRHHNLVESDSNALLHLTELGRLAGVSGTEVESVIRVVDAFQQVRSPNE